MSIEQVLSELNEYAMRASAESLRIITITRLRYAMLQIGKDIVGVPEDIEIELIKGKYEIPENILHIEDVGLEKGVYRGMNARRGNYNLSNLVFTKTERELFFPNMPSGKVWLKVYKFPTDEFGEVDIPIEAYPACVKYCAAEMVAKMPTSPYFPDRWNMESKAMTEIRVATGLLSERSKSDLRNERHRK